MENDTSNATPNNTMSIKKTIHAVTIATVIFFNLANPASASLEKALQYDGLAAYVKANTAFTEWAEEANAAYGALIATSSPAANAVYYECVRNSNTDYLEGIAIFYTNYYYWLSLTDPGNIVSYRIAAELTPNAYYDAALDYYTAYSTFVSIVTWGGNERDQMDRYRYSFGAIYDLEMDIAIPAAEACAPSLYQYFIVYEAAGRSLFEAYHYLMNYYFAAGGVAATASGGYDLDTYLSYFNFAGKAATYAYEVKEVYDVYANADGEAALL